MKKLKDSRDIKTYKDLYDFLSSMYYDTETFFYYLDEVLALKENIDGYNISKFQNDTDRIYDMVDEFINKILDTLEDIETSYDL